ncbi:MAG: hypothetical protein NVSMB55_16650 [Mycobacteriales bacterium]
MGFGAIRLPAPVSSVCFATETSHCESRLRACGWGRPHRHQPVLLAGCRNGLRREALHPYDGMMLVPKVEDRRDDGGAWLDPEAPTREPRPVNFAGQVQLN